MLILTRIYTSDNKVIEVAEVSSVMNNHPYIILFESYQMAAYETYTGALNGALMKAIEFSGGKVVHNEHIDETGKELPKLYEVYADVPF